MLYYVYILQSRKDGRFYTGMTDNVERRLAQHNKGSTGTPSTQNRGPFDLIYKEKCETRELARAREKYWKSGVGREKRLEFIAKYMVPVAQSVERRSVAAKAAGS